MWTATCSLTYCEIAAVTAAGLIVCETDVEIACRVSYTFSGGRPMSFNRSWGNWEPPEDPEIEITGIEVFGHSVDNPNGPLVYASLPVDDPLWSKIARWAENECFSELCEAAAEDRPHRRAAE